MTTAQALFCLGPQHSATLRRAACHAYFAGLTRFTQTVVYGNGAQSQSGPNDEPVSLNGGGYSTDNTKTAATNARTATIAANSLKDGFGEFDGFQRNLGVGLFIKRGANCVIIERKQLA